MRLILQLYDEFLQRKTIRLEIDSQESTDALIKAIQQKVGRLAKDLKIKFKKDHFMIQIIPGWPLSFYDFNENQIIVVEIRETDAEQKEKESKRQHIKYLGKLGIQGQQFSKLSNVSETSENSDDDQPQKKSAIDFKPADIEDQVFELIKTNNDKALVQLFNSRDASVLNTATFGGWNPIHFATFLENKPIVQFLLSQDVDVNKTTDDGWTPLLIAVHKHNIDIVKVLLEDTSLDVNQVAEKGVALHLACKTNQFQMIQLLVEKNANPTIQDKTERSAIDYCTEETLNFMEKQKKKTQINTQLKTIDEQFIPPKPPVTKGFIYKTGQMLITLNERFFVLHVDDGTFIRYKSKADYPLKPLEIIALKSIKSVIMMTQRSLISKPGFHYFELLYSSRMVLACKHEWVAKRWVELIYKAAVYCQYIEDKISAGEISITPVSKIDEITIEDIDEPIPKTQLKPTFPLQGQQPQRAQSPESSLALPKTEEAIMRQRMSQPNPTAFSTDSLSSQIESLVSGTRVQFDSFEIIKELGSGAFGKVFLVRKKDDNKVYAMKALKKKTLIIRKQLKYAVTEANVLKSCKHPFILGLHYSFQTPNYLYLVLDYCKGGDLSFHLAQESKFPEDAARFYAAELILAIEFLHQRDIVYRDMKPENILIDSQGHIKLADFGLSKEGISDQDKAKSFCGSPAYLSPDMLSQKGAGKPSDIYGIGAVLYEMIAGESPYYNEDIQTMYKAIQSGQLKWPKKMSIEAKALITKMLERDPEKRIQISQIKKDPFFKNTDWDRVLRCEEKPPITDFSQMQEDDEIDEGEEGGYKGKPIFEDKDYDEQNLKVNRVKNFSFITHQEA